MASGPVARKPAPVTAQPLGEEKNMNKENIPNELHCLIPMAEKWGIGDDYDREVAVSNATAEELTDLVKCLDQVDDGDLFGWLAGPESFSANPTEEYVVFTCMTMAYASAKLKIEKQKSARG